MVGANFPAPNGGLLVFTYIGGNPACTSYNGRDCLWHSDNGLPIGVQIIGGFLEDRTTIAFAGLVERQKICADMKFSAP
jgi:Asp-tRNA(Asn)/Glu-tRNA(Gln) amidotransferase A subunit family amidase